MATIYNTDTREIIEAACIVDGQDILADVMGNSGLETIQPWADEGDTTWAFALDADEAAWWIRWAEREERIAAAYEDANEEQRLAYERAVDEYGYDFEAQQDAEEAALGLGPIE